eukprot:Hpha_TRINITY_DN22622_c0_g1::TRINITY_DN22622_c0_g1_i1::g.192735::m.192735/K18752/TNPO1, IPO2, KPNB2; transportin-1
MAEGEPSAQQLAEVAAAFQAGMNVTDSAAQVRVNTWIEEHARAPLFNSALSVVATTPASLPDVTRRVCALTLKNNCSRFYRTGFQPARHFIQGRLLQGLCDPDEGVRSAVASCVSAAARCGGLGDWPGLVRGLLQQVQSSTDPVGRRGVLVCVRDLCEDCVDELDLPEPDGSPAPTEMLVRRLGEMLSSSGDPSELALSVDALRYLMEADAGEAPGSPLDAVCREVSDGLCAALTRCLELFKGGGGGGHRVRASCVHCLRVLLHYYPNLKAAGHLGGLYNRVLELGSDPSPEVCLAACEFWGCLAQTRPAVDDLATQGQLALLVTHLAARLRYSDMEVGLLEEEERAEQLDPPCRARYRRRHVEDEDEEGGNEVGVQQYTLRKCAAASLDALTQTAGSVVISPPGQPQGWLLTAVVGPMLASADWREREAGVLALGSVMNGEAGSLGDSTGAVVQQLLGLVEDHERHWLERAAGYFALSAAQQWIAAAGGEYLLRYLNAVLGGLASPVRKVQEAAASAFAQIVSTASDAL